MRDSLGSASSGLSMILGCLNLVAWEADHHERLVFPSAVLQRDRMLCLPLPLDRQPAQVAAAPLFKEKLGALLLRQPPSLFVDERVCHRSAPA